jgi:hypothetical protein
MVRVRNISFKMGRATPDIVCGVKHWFSCVLDHPAAMSGLAIVVCAPVFTVTRHTLPPTLPCLTRLGLAISVMTVNM